MQRGSPPARRGTGDRTRVLVPDRRSMKYIAPATGTLCLTLAAAWAQAQDCKPAPPPQLKKLDVWIGNRALSGTARDQPGSLPTPIGSRGA